MNKPVSLMLTIVSLHEGISPSAEISIGELEPSPVRISLSLSLPVLDSPENLQDFARQALAALCEAL